MTNQNRKLKPKTMRGYEDCRVIEVGVGDFVECAKWGPVTCAHALSFGHRYLCMHPRAGELLENTKKTLQAEKV